MSVRYETLFAGNVPVGGMNLDVDCEGMGIAPLGANNGAGGISVIYDNSLGAVRVLSVAYLKKDGTAFAVSSFTTWLS